MLASALISRITDVNQDATNVRWVEAELLRWISDGQREVVIHKPEATATNTTLTLTANTTKQTVSPATAITLIDIVRNMGTSGSTPGRAIRYIEREILDAQRPNWHTESAAGEIKHYMHNPRDPLTFYVWPAPNAALRVEAVYSAVPADISATSSNLSVSDVYAGALVDYVLYRAYSKDAEYAGNANRAIAHYTAFANALGIKTQNDIKVSPGANAQMNPNARRSA